MMYQNQRRSKNIKIIGNFIACKISEENKINAPR